MRTFALGASPLRHFNFKVDSVSELESYLPQTTLTTTSGGSQLFYCSYDDYSSSHGRFLVFFALKLHCYSWIEKVVIPNCPITPFFSGWYAGSGEAVSSDSFPCISVKRFSLLLVDALMGAVNDLNVRSVFYKLSMTNLVSKNF